MWAGASVSLPRGLRAGFYNDTGTMQGYIARWDSIDTFALNNQVGEVPGRPQG
jgi:hypothetical protein